MRSIFCFVILIILTSIVRGQLFKTSSFDGQSTIGTLKIPGKYQYNNNTQEFTLTASGSNMWDTHDNFFFAWKKMKGDFILNARVKWKTKGKNEHRKIGWMVRQSLDSTSPYADVALHGDGLTSLQYRKANGGVTEEIKSEIKNPDVLQIRRKGNVYIVSDATFGEALKEAARTTVDLTDEVYAGIFICSHEENVSESAVFSNVRISIPQSDTSRAYRGAIGSVLEVMDVATGNRKIIYSTPDVIEAPNWMPDGKHLLYNSNGLLHKFSLASKTSVPLNTDFAKRNNNDHVISFDGKWIALSNMGTETSPSGDSKVFVVPIEGGKPRQITPIGPSYLHGWSTDGKTLVYCAARNNKYDVYAIPVEGGEEKRLTDAEGLDDGPEYSPDGKYIYFNSNRTGLMQIWRMKPDGSEQEQVTNDDLNNWFAHISPNGKWMVFVTFGKDVKSGDHPPNKEVMIRLMPVDKSQKPKTLAYVYGGQGTINVPSWSPDGKQIAFVSYSF